MKRLSFLLITLVFTCFCLYSQELITILNNGNPVADSGITDPVVLKNKAGHLFFAYIKDYQLKIKRSTDGGNSFTDYTPNLGAYSFTAFRELTLYERNYEDWLVFFVGTEQGRQGIYALEFDDNGDLQLAYGQQLDDAAIPGDIIRYEVHPDRRSGFIVAWTKDNYFGLRFVDNYKYLHTPQLVSSAVDTVTGFSLQERMYVDRLEHYGAYTADNGTGSRLVYFELDPGMIVHTYELFSTFRQDIEYKLVKTDNGRAYCIYEKQGNIYALCFSEGIWTELNQGLPLNYDQGSVSQFETIAPGDAVNIVFSAENEGKIDVFEGVIDENNVYSIAREGQPLNKETVQGKFSVFTYGKARALLGFIEQGDTNSRLSVFSREPCMNMWQDISYSMWDLNNIEDFNFHLLSDGTPVLGALQKQGNDYREIVYGISSMYQEENSLFFEHRVENPQVVPGDAAWAGNNLVRSYGDKLLVLNPLRYKKGSLDGAGQPLAVHSPNGENYMITGNNSQVMLHRLAPDPAAPSGAIWTAGSPYNPESGMVRLYTWDDEDTKGGKKFEVQRYEWHAPVYWNGEDMGDTGEYMRFFKFMPGDEVEVTVEVWSDTERKGIYSGVLGQSGVEKSGMMSVLKGPQLGEGTASSEFPKLIRTEYNNQGYKVYEIYQITDNDYSDMYPQIDNGQIVWQGDDRNGEDIYLFIEDSKTTEKITNNNYGNWYPQINNNKIVWIGYDGYDGEIYLWDMDSETIKKITNNIYNDIRPQIDNGQIVWSGWVENTNSEIFYWEEGLTTPLTISNNDYNDLSPQINNGQVVWNGRDEDRSYHDEIYFWEYSLITPKKITDDDFYNYGQQIHNNLVVWHSISIFDVDASEIYFWKYNLTSPIKITDNIFSDDSPQIHNGQIVWIGYDENDGEIYLWYEGIIEPIKITDNDYNDIRPQIDNGQIVWQCVDGNAAEIYLWEDSLTIPIQITNNDYYNEWPQIHNGHIVWHSYDGYDREIFLSIFDWTEVDINHSNGNIFDEIIYTNNDIILTAQAKNNHLGTITTLDPIIYDYEYSIDQGEPQPGHTAIVTEEGLHRVEFRILDRYGNWVTEQTTVCIDRTPPVIETPTIDASFDYGIWIGSNASVDVSTTAYDPIPDGLTQEDISGIDILEHKIGEHSPYNEGLVVTISSEGANEVFFKATDLAGNSTEISTTVGIDTTPPEITGFTITDASDDTIDLDTWTNTSQVTVVAEATDDPQDIGGCGVDPSTWQYSLYQYPRAENPTPLEQGSGNTVYVDDEGEYDVVFTVSDYLGHTSDEQPATVRIDRQSPAISAEGSNGWQDLETFTATAQGTDAASGLAEWYYYIGDPDDTEITWYYFAGEENQVEKDISGQGIQTVWFKAVDRAGNAATAQAVVMLDNQAPTITIPAGGWTNGIITATAEDLGSGVNHGTWQWSMEKDTGTGDWINWQDGQTTDIDIEGNNIEIAFRVEDNVGYSGFQTAFVMVDKTGPEIELQDITIDGGIATITASADDPYGIMQLDETSWQWSLEQVSWYAGNIAQVPATTPVIWFRVADGVGNLTEQVFSLSFDQDPPVIEPYIVTDGVDFSTWTGKEEVWLGADIYDVGDAGLAGAWYSINGGNEIEWTAGQTFKLNQSRRNVIVFRAIDNALNENTDECQIWIDRLVPVITPAIETGGVNPGEWTNIAPVTVSATANDGGLSGVDAGTWQNSTDDTNWSGGNSLEITGDGETNVIFTVDDEVGNKGRAEIEVWLDTTGPVITASVAPYIFNDGGQEYIEVTSLDAQDGEAGITSEDWYYAFDEGESYEELPVDHKIDTSSLLPEGLHTLKLRIADDLDNKGYALLDFTVDRTPAQITGVSVPLGPGGYSLTDTVEITVTAQDSLGEVDYFEYVVLAIGTDTPDFSAATIEQAVTFDISALNQGANYIYIRAIDQAGNAGSHVEVIVRVDSAKPGQPVIVGLTHPRA